MILRWACSKRNMETSQAKAFRPEAGFFAEESSAISYGDYLRKKVTLLLAPAPNNALLRERTLQMVADWPTKRSRA